MDFLEILNFCQKRFLWNAVRQVDEAVRQAEILFLRGNTSQMDMVDLELLRQMVEASRKIVVLVRQCIIDEAMGLHLSRTSEPEYLNTKVCRCAYRGKWDPDSDASNRIKDIFLRGLTVFIVVYDVQGGSSGPMKVEKGLTKKKTHKGAKGGRARERSISGDQDGKAVRGINRDPDPAPHIQKTGRPQAFSQANGGVEGRDESRDGLEREKGSGGSLGGSMGGGQEEEAVPDIKRDCHQTLHNERNRMPEVGFGVSQANGSVERQGGSPDECRDAEGEGSRSGANQARDGEGEGSSSGESQGQDRGEGSASGENQGGDRNTEGSGSNDDEDNRERERQRRVRGDIEQGIEENNQEEIDFSGIAEAFLAIIGATSIAAVEFHSNRAISSTILSLLMAINVFGFLCCMTSMLHRHRKPRAARIFGTIGVAAAGLGLLLLVSVYFSSYYGWMILGLGSLAILVICVWAFRP